MEDSHLLTDIIPEGLLFAQSLNSWHCGKTAEACPALTLLLLLLFHLDTNCTARENLRSATGDYVALEAMVNAQVVLCPVAPNSEEQVCAADRSCRSTSSYDLVLATKFSHNHLTLLRIKYCLEEMGSTRIWWADTSSWTGWPRW